MCNKYGWRLGIIYGENKEQATTKLNICK